MATDILTWTRTDSSLQSVIATVEHGRIQTLQAAVTGERAPCVPAERPRFTTPQKRVGDRFEAVPWDQAIREIGAKMTALRSQGSHTALLAGRRLGADSFGSIRAMAVQLALGPATLHSFLADDGGPLIRAAELVIGHPVVLQADVARAHYAVLLGANQAEAGWGPLQCAPSMDRELAHARKVKSNKLVAADPRRPSLAAGADTHLPIRPGTELWFLLGMVRHILDNNWRDVQYTDDWTHGLAELTSALAPWTVDRCAAVCGITAGDLGGIALKFSRAAMAVVHLSAQAQRGPNATATAWASLVLHAITANLLRPGGLYANKGLGPAEALLAELGSDKAPVVAGKPLLLAQASAHLLTERMLTPGHDQVRGLISLCADPATELAGPNVVAALSGLDLLVVVDTAHSATSALAHWILPTLEPFEREDIHLLDTVVLPRRELAFTPAIVPAPGDAQPTETILLNLFKTQRPAFKSPFGPHVRLRAALVARGDLRKWANGKLGSTPVGSLERLRAEPWDGGDVDRATWNITHPDGKLQLLPALIAGQLAHLSEPKLGPNQTHFLLTSAARDPLLSALYRDADPGVGLHPDSGFSDGQTVEIRTDVGAVRATVHLDPTLRSDTADLPAGYKVNVGGLIPSDRLDVCTGTAAWDGLGCAIRAVGP